MDQKKERNPVADNLPSDKILRRIDAHSEMGAQRTFTIYAVKVIEPGILRSGGFSKALIDPALQPYLDNERRRVWPAPRADEVFSVVLDIGSLPSVKLGDLYEGKQKQSEAKRRAHPYGISKTLSVTLDTSSCVVKKLSESGITKNEYAFTKKKFGESNVLRFDAIVTGGKSDGKKCQVVIPCVEIFGTYYAANSDIANALLSYPYDVAMSKLINPEKSEKTENNICVVLRRGVSEDAETLLTQRILALLQFDNRARSAAKELHLQNTPGSFFMARIPTSKETLKLTGECRWTRTEEQELTTLFMHRITKTETPISQAWQIEFWREVGGVAGDEVVGAEGALPFRLKPAIAGTAVVETTADQGSVRGADRVQSFGGQSLWDGPTNVKEIKPPETKKYDEKSVVPGQKRSEGKSSTKDQGYGGIVTPETNIKAAPEVENVTSDRLTTLMKEVALVGKETSSPQEITFKVLEPDQSDVEWTYGAQTLKLWPFERKNESGEELRWSFLESQGVNRRGAMVLEIAIDGILTAYAVDLAHRKSEKYHLFLVKPKDSIALSMQAFREFCVRSKPTLATKKGNEVAAANLFRDTVNLAIAVRHKPKEGWLRRAVKRHLG
jgi:hypothetical protein